MKTILLIVLLIGTAFSGITQIDAITEGIDNWSDATMTADGGYAILYNMSTYSFDAIATTNGAKTSSSAYASGDQIKAVGALNDSDDFFCLFKGDGATRVVKKLAMPGFTETEYTISSGESDIPESITNAAANNDNTKYYFTSSYKLVTFTVSGTAATVVDVTADGNCSLSSSDPSLENGWLQPELDRFIVSDGSKFCVLTISTGAVVERSVTYTSDTANVSPFGTQHVALEDRDNKKLVIKDWTDDSVTFTYSWSDDSWAKYFWPSGDGQKLIAPFNNGGPLVIINAQNNCQFLVSDFDVSDNGPSFTSNGTKIVVLDTDSLQIITADYSKWQTYTGCSAGDTEVSWEYEDNKDENSFSGILNITVLSFVLVLSII